MSRAQPAAVVKLSQINEKKVVKEPHEILRNQGKYEVRDATSNPGKWQPLALGTAIVWAGIVTRLTTEHELVTTILFAASMPCLIASAIFSAIAAVRLGKPPESRRKKEGQRG